MPDIQLEMLPFADAEASLRSPYAIDDLVVAAELPILVVDAAGQKVQPDMASSLRALPAVTIGVGTTDPAFDVVVDGPGILLDAITSTVSDSTDAALALVQVLRAGEGLGVIDALALESFAYAALLGSTRFATWLAGRSTRPREERDGLEVARDGDVLRVTFSRPEVHNAYSAMVRDRLSEALQLALADESITSVVLAGAGASFCSGGDLDEFGTAADPMAAHRVRTARSPAALLTELGPRAEARVHGAAIGAGCELAACCGRVTATEDAWFALPEIAMGLIPGAGGTMSLPRKIGRQRTARLALTGEKLDAPGALVWGLVDRVVAR